MDELLRPNLNPVTCVIKLSNRGKQSNCSNDSYVRYYRGPLKNHNCTPWCGCHIYQKCAISHQNLRIKKSQWEIRMSNSKKVPYFFNTETKQSVWEAPPSLSEEEIKALPGYEYLSNNGNPHAGQVRASHLLIKHKDSRRPSSWKEVRD